MRPEWENYLPHNETQLSSHLTTDGAEHLSQQSRHFALFEGQVSLAVEDAEDDVAEPGDGDGPAQRLRPLAASEVNQMQPRPGKISSVFENRKYCFCVEY